jgi:hypothetical protein
VQNVLSKQHKNLCSDTQKTCQTLTMFTKDDTLFIKKRFTLFSLYYSRSYLSCYDLRGQCMYSPFEIIYSVKDDMCKENVTCHIV